MRRISWDTEMVTVSKAVFLVIAMVAAPGCASRPSGSRTQSHAAEAPASAPALAHPAAAKPAFQGLEFSTTKDAYQKAYGGLPGYLDLMHNWASGDCVVA
jgi:hypothetical protein